MSEERNDPLADDVLAFVRADKDRASLSPTELLAIREGVEQKIFEAHASDHRMSFPPQVRARAHRLRRASLFATGAFVGASLLGAVLYVRHTRMSLFGGHSTAAVDLNASRSMIEAGRGALLSGRADSALSLVEMHARDFPSGPGTEDRESLRVESLVALHRDAEARLALERFAEAYPHSPRIGILRRLFSR